MEQYFDTRERRGVGKAEGFDAERLVELRRERGLTQRRLADAADVNKLSIAAYEKRRRTPSVAIAMRVATALGVDVETIAPGTGHRPDDGLRVMRRYRSLTVADMAARLEISPRVVEKVEAGASMPEHPREWARAYGMTLDWFRRSWTAASVEWSDSHPAD